MILQRNMYPFENSKPTESPMKWNGYEKLVKKEWKSLLSDKNKKEGDFQEFIEQHPCMLPRPFNYGVGVTDNSFPGVISQPVLPSYDKKVPDFMVMTMNSSEYCATLIEIEDPAKKWFTTKGNPSANLTQAVNQINSWKIWFDEPKNKISFLDYYNVSIYSRKHYTFKQGYILIYGRRDDKTLNYKTNKTRAQLQGNDAFMTYDRLAPNLALSNSLCVKLKNDRYQAVSIPPTFEYTENYDYHLCLIKGKKEAVNKNKYMNEEQKKYLIKQFSGLDQWGEGNISANSIEIFGM